MKPILFAVLFLFTPHLQQNLYVTDGDTIRLNGKRIRLTCIDAPEKTQPYGLEAKERCHLSFANINSKLLIV
jgi:hypothetical protein